MPEVCTSLIHNLVAWVRCKLRNLTACAQQGIWDWFSYVWWLFKIKVWFAFAFAIPGSFLLITSILLIRFGSLFSLDVNSLVLSIWSFTFLVLMLIGCGALGELVLHFTHWITIGLLSLVERLGLSPIAARPDQMRPPRPPPDSLSRCELPHSWRLPLKSTDKTSGNTSMLIAPTSSKHR